jgi:hypothetical protein
MIVGTGKASAALRERIEGALPPGPQIRFVRSKLVLGPEIELALRAGHA